MKMHSWHRGLIMAVAGLLTGLPLQSSASDGVAVDSDWLTMREISLDIKADSPLDFSRQFPEHAAPLKHPVQINADGNFTLGGKETRFLCAPMILTPPYGGYPDKATSDRYAAQLRRAGYNLVRLMHLESTLMHEQREDFAYDAEQTDRMHYFVAALKREGIYWLSDAMSSENGSIGGVTPHRWVKKHNLLVRVYVDPVAQQHWRDQVERLLGKVNPYTGKSMLADEAMFGLILVNEGSLQFLTHLRKKVPDEVVPRLMQWLKKRYTDPAAFEKVWKKPLAILDQGGLPMPAPGERSAQMDDVLSFYQDLHAETAQWMQAHLRKLGYRGPLTSFNNNPSTLAIRSRANFRWADMHYYHDEGFGFEPGAKIRNDSAFDKNLQYITGLAVSQMAGRAFTVSEYGQPFWNEWRRETALVPAFASLHNWDAICHHASTAVDLTYAQTRGWKQSIIPYALGLDPVARASETLAALLYRRGDVKTAKEFVEITLPGGAAENSARYWGIARDMERNALVMRTLLRVADEPDSKPLPGAQARLAVSNESKVGRKVDDLLAKLGGPLVARDKDAVETLAKTAMPSNRSDIAAGVYHSVTGELQVDMKARRFEARTPKTEVMVFDSLERSHKLGVLTVLQADAPALVGLAALDGQALSTSKKMLLVVATDALNTGMRFSNAKRQELVKLGRLPARIKPIQIKFELAGKGGKLQVQAMRQSGELTDMVPVQEQAQAWNIALDMAKLPSGPTFYYYVTRQ